MTEKRKNRKKKEYLGEDKMLAIGKDRWKGMSFSGIAKKYRITEVRVKQVIRQLQRNKVKFPRYKGEDGKSIYKIVAEKMKRWIRKEKKSKGT